MATRIRKQWLDLTYSPTGLTADDIKHSDTTTVKSVIDDLSSKIAYRTLTVTKSGTGTGIVTSDPSGINCGSTCSYQFTFGTNITLTATPDSGSAFGGWSGDVTDSSSTIIVTMDSNKSVTAIFNTLYSLTITKSGTGTGTVISSPSGINCGSACSYQFVPGTNVTLTATSDSGSVFSGWSGDVACSCSTIIVTMDSNKSVVAGFNALYTLTVTKSGTGIGTVTSFPSGINCGATCSYQFASGTNVTLTATPDSSFVFDGWSGDVTSSNSTITVTMDSNKSVTATFNFLYTLTVIKLGAGTGTVTSSPSGINCGVICSHQFSSGTNVTLTATSDSGSVFGEWSGDVTGSNSTITVTMNLNKSVTAIFNVLYTLTITKAGTGTGTVISNPAGIDCGATCSYQFVEGTSITLTATPDSSFVFDGWSGDVTDPSSTITFTMDDDKDITATFNVLYTLTVTKSGAGTGTVTSDPDGIDCGATCSYQFSSGTDVTLTATPDSLSSFGGWSGGATGINPIIIITMNSDKNMTAIFNVYSEGGYFAGGYNSDNSSGYNYSFIDKLSFSDESRSTLITTLSQSIWGQSACNSTLAGYFAGGYGNRYQSFIDKLLFSDELRSTLTATLSQSANGQSACNSTSSGYFAGGFNNTYQSYIDTLSFSDESRYAIEATLSQSVQCQSACNSLLAGYFAGGNNYNNGNIYYSYIDKLLFSNESRSTLSIVLSQSIWNQSACNSTSSGYFSGGSNHNYQSFIDKLLFSDETRSTLTAILSRTVGIYSACNSTLSGYFAGGYNGSFQSFINRLLFSDETRTTLTATLSQSVRGQSACQSGSI
jgi:hypothetical protein